MNQVLLDKQVIATQSIAAEQSTGDEWLHVVAMFVHDLELPLASMKYLVGLLDQQKLDLRNTRHQRLVKSSRIAVERAEATLYDLLQVAKSGQGALPVELEKADLAPFVQEALTLAAGNAEETEVKLEFVRRGVNSSAVVDVRLFKRVLDNLIFNALRHTPTRGRIAVTVEETGRGVRIEVHDSGSGLGDIDTEQLFEKYGQVRLRVQGKHRGVGLGLYFCKLAVERMGGVIGAANHADGGAVFTIELPNPGKETR